MGQGLPRINLKGKFQCKWCALTRNMDSRQLTIAVRCELELLYYLHYTQNDYVYRGRQAIPIEDRDADHGNVHDVGS